MELESASGSGLERARESALCWESGSLVDEVLAQESGREMEDHQLRSNPG